MHSEFHFLVVDDMPTVRHMVGSLLKGLGYTKISEAGDGEQALRILQSGGVAGVLVNFVVTDWNMPIMDGLTLLRTIRSIAGLQHLPVLVVTSESTTDCITAAIQAGADGYLLKSFLSTGTLKETLDDILQKRGKLLQG